MPLYAIWQLLYDVAFVYRWTRLGWKKYVVQNLEAHISWIHNKQSSKCSAISNNDGRRQRRSELRTSCNWGNPKAYPRKVEVHFLLMWKLFQFRIQVAWSMCNTEYILKTYRAIQGYDFISYNQSQNSHDWGDLHFFCGADSKSWKPQVQAQTQSRKSISLYRVPCQNSRQNRSFRTFPRGYDGILPFPNLT